MRISPEFCFKERESGHEVTAVICLISWDVQPHVCDLDPQGSGDIAQSHFSLVTTEYAGHKVCLCWSEQCLGKGMLPEKRAGEVLSENPTRAQGDRRANKGQDTLRSLVLFLCVPTFLPGGNGIAHGSGSSQDYHPIPPGLYFSHLDRDTAS